MSHAPLFLAALSLLGAGVGYASGLFGVGGGFMLTPLLIAIFGIPANIAVGSGLAQMIAVGLGATRRHAAAGYVDGRLGGYIMPGVLLGSAAGVFLLDMLERLGHTHFAGHKIPIVNLVISGLFIITLVWVAIHLWRESQVEEGPTHVGNWCWPQGPLPITLEKSGITHCSLLSLLATGLIVGVLAGLLGIGGGVILIPILLYGFCVPLRMAIGTSSLIILASALIGTALHAINGNVNLWLVAALMVGSVIGVQIGAWHSHRLHVSHLQRAFAALVLAVAIILIVRLVY